MLEADCWVVQQLTQQIGNRWAQCNNDYCQCWTLTVAWGTYNSEATVTLDILGISGVSSGALHMKEMTRNDWWRCATQRRVDGLQLDGLAQRKCVEIQQGPAMVLFDLRSFEQNKKANSWPGLQRNTRQWYKWTQQTSKGCYVEMHWGFLFEWMWMMWAKDAC